MCKPRAMHDFIVWPANGLLLYANTEGYANRGLLNYCFAWTRAQGDRDPEGAVFRVHIIRQYYFWDGDTVSTVDTLE